MILRPLITDDASIVAAECMRREVEGEDVEIGRRGTDGFDAVEVGDVACFIAEWFDDAGVDVAAVKELAAVVWS
jgi:hypothetical protein